MNLDSSVHCLPTMSIYLLFLVGSEFANGPRDQGSIPDQVIPNTQTMVFVNSSLKAQHYKVHIKSKVTLPLHFGVVAIEKEAFGSLNCGCKFYFTFISIEGGKLQIELCYFCTASTCTFMCW